MKLLYQVIIQPRVPMDPPSKLHSDSPEPLVIVNTNTNTVDVLSRRMR